MNEYPLLIVPMVLWCSWLGERMGI